MNKFIPAYVKDLIIKKNYNMIYIVELGYFFMAVSKQQNKNIYLKEWQKFANDWLHYIGDL